MTNIYREPDPRMGPDRVSDAYPMGPDRDEVLELRRLITGIHIIDPATAPQVSPEEFANFDPRGPEQFDSHEEYMAARDLEQWGYNPFTEYEE